MRESTVSPKVSVSDTKPKSDYIKVRNNGADHASHPNSLSYVGFVETGSNAEGDHCMRERRCHVRRLLANASIE
jgi:hypothetical protein